MSEPQSDSILPPTARPAAPAVTVRHLLTLAVWTFVFAIAGWWFDPIKNVLLGFIATAAVASTLAPLMRLSPGPRTLRAVVVGVLPLLVILAIGFGSYGLMHERIHEELVRLPQAHDAINKTLAGWSSKLGLQETLTLKGIAASAGQALMGSGSGEVFAGVTQFLGGVLIALACVLFGGIYLLADDNEKSIVAPIQRLLPERKREPFAQALRDIVPRLRWWLLGAFFGMTAVGIAASLGYWAVGVELAVPLGILTGLSEIVPTLGPAASFVVGVMLAAGHGGKTVLGVIGIYAVVQTLESNVLQPLVMRKAVEMPPVITLFTALLWGQVFGAPGLILAIPINIVIWAFVTRLVIEEGIEPRRHEDMNQMQKVSS